MEDFSNKVLCSMSPEDRENFYKDYLRIHATNPSSNLCAIPGPSQATAAFQPSSSTAESSDTSDFNNLDEMMNSFKAILTATSARTEADSRYFPSVLLCANNNPGKNFICTEKGTKACSGCKLVSYCSKECQKIHWRRHKPECNDFIKSDKWRPAWVTERRRAMFLTEGMDVEPPAGFSIGMSLWGNTPAMDVINFDQNENNLEKDYSLAFIASGDLRHVIQSINSLPSNYTGKVNILLNDHNPLIAIRNLVLLLILANIPDQLIAANMAIHFWYSLFLPSEFKLQISWLITSFMHEHHKNIDNDYPFRLGPTSSLQCSFLPESKAKEILMHFVSSSLSIEDAQCEYDRVRMAPSRRDYRDRMYAQLRPSHRAAFQRFRKFGILLPFGAFNAHFNVPNQSLFSCDGKWLQTDFADPLEGWDIVQVLEAGKARGVQEEDIYGCLHFFLQDELQTFIKQLRKLSISFAAYSFDASILADVISHDGLSEHGYPASTCAFDRIFVSNILDKEYVGVRGVITKWGKLLARTRDDAGARAAMVGYFMNWTRIQRDGTAEGSGSELYSKLIRQILDEGRVKHPLFTAPSENRPALSMSMLGDLETAIYIMAVSIEALHENSEAFSKYLRSEKLDSILRGMKLKMRKIHSIVPPRIGVPLTAKFDALPEFLDDEDWYRQTQIGSYTWSERYVEFVPSED